MALSRELALSYSQLDELMTSAWNMRIATIGPGMRVNLTPMWFGWAGGRIYTYGRGQKVVNIRRQPEVTVLVDRNEHFFELQGAMFQGHATVLEDAAAEHADPFLEQARRQMALKYHGGHTAPDVDPGPVAERNTATAAGRSRRWMVIEPDRTVTWDNFKLPR
jgi:nitroimidazol reductase NimA-like FMN-containing flavoprotein (pyridoxamine 5'-phosphate oxidase superfamily)